jgi:cell division protease FtsH
MGGRIAEELIFGKEKVTTGASSDIKMATDMSRRMVTEWGMSDKLGPLSYGENDQEVFLGHSVTTHKNVSEQTSKTIDEEVRLIVDTAYRRAMKTLTDHLDQLHMLAKGLLEFETLSGDEIHQLMRGETVKRDVGSDDAGGGKPSTPPRRSSVPTTGIQPGFGAGPEPQPGS